MTASPSSPPATNTEHHVRVHHPAQGTLPPKAREARAEPPAFSEVHTDRCRRGRRLRRGPKCCPTVDNEQSSPVVRASGASEGGYRLRAPSGGLPYVCPG
jgi:hypothetical protein